MLGVKIVRGKDELFSDNFIIRMFQFSYKRRTAPTIKKSYVATNGVVRFISAKVARAEKVLPFYLILNFRLR